MPRTLLLSLLLPLGLAIIGIPLVLAQSPSQPAPTLVPPAIVPAAPPMPQPSATPQPLPPVAPAPGTPPFSPGAAVTVNTTASSTASVKNYGTAGNTRADLLRRAPPKAFDFDRSSLRDVLRYLAAEADIPYVGPSDTSPKAQDLVTFRMQSSPFAALESVARQYGVSVSFEDGVWFLAFKDDVDKAAAESEKSAGESLRQQRFREMQERSKKDMAEGELVAVIYQLKHDPVDRVDFRSDTTSSMGVNNSGNGNNQFNQNGSTASPNLPLQNSQNVFEVRAPRIVNEIRVMLGMRPLEYNADGTVKDPEIEAGEKKEVPLGEDYAGTNRATIVGQGYTASVYTAPQRPQVIYNADSNILWVVATRKQHKWVAEYLQKVDKPQDLIAIEVKFFETKKNPQTELGINWQNTFGTGITVKGSAGVGGTDIGNITYNYNSGTTIGGSNVSFQNRGLSMDAPYSAVLSVGEVSATLQAFMQDRASSLVQYPRVLTINNREVAITAAENTPINGGTTSVGSSTGTSAQNVGSLQYIPTGTQINILPKTVGSEQIALTVAITISSIVGTVPINLGTGVNDYPITSERVYNATLQVDSGYTLAVGGLEKVDDKNNSGGIPVLKDIPGVGYLFKNKSRSRNKTNLIIFITPYLVSDPSKTPGISEKPEAVVPLRPGVPPKAPQFGPDGQLVGGESQVPNALAWLDYQLRYYTQINDENRTDRASIAGLRQVIQAARNLDADLNVRVDNLGDAVPQSLSDQKLRAKDLLIDLNKTLGAAQDNLF